MPAHLRVSPLRAEQNKYAVSDSPQQKSSSRYPLEIVLFYTVWPPLDFAEKDGFTISNGKFFKPKLEAVLP